MSYDAPSYTGNEGRSVNPIVSITPTPNRSITVGLTATTGTTESGDYTRTATQARFNATTTSVGFNVNFADDNDCDDEDFSLGFSGLPDDVRTGTQAAPTVAIEDDDNCVVNISASPTNPAENSNVTVTVSIPSNSPISNRSLSIPVVVAAGTAEADDYSVSGLPVTISPGSRSATFTISVSEDALEDCENDTVIARFGARRGFPDNVVTGSSTGVTIVIQDDEPTRDCQYVVTYDRSSYSGDEGDSVSPVISITPTPNRSITVGLTATTGTTESGDYTRTATQARFNATTTSVGFNVNFADDNDCDDEDFSLGFSGLPDDVETGTQAAPDVDIDDLDTCKLKFSGGSDISLTEGGSARRVTVEFLDGITTDRQVTVPIDVRGSGAYSFTGLNSQDELVFRANARSDSFNMAAGQDTDCDHESLTLELGSPAPSDVRLSTPNEVGVNITDDDDCVTAPIITIARHSNTAETIDEGESADFTLTASPAPTSKITVRVHIGDMGSYLERPLPSNCPSPQPPLFVTTCNVSINANSSTGSLALSTLDDTRDEDHGTITVTVQSGAGYSVGSPSAATVAVKDNDLPAVANLRANGHMESGQIKLRWDKISDATTYDVRYEQCGSGRCEIPAGAPGPAWTLAPGQTGKDALNMMATELSFGGLPTNRIVASHLYQVSVQAVHADRAVTSRSPWSDPVMVYPTTGAPATNATNQHGWPLVRVAGVDSFTFIEDGLYSYYICTPVDDHPALGSGYDKPQPLPGTFTTGDVTGAANTWVDAVKWVDGGTNIVRMDYVDVVGTHNPHNLCMNPSVNAYHSFNQVIFMDDQAATVYCQSALAFACWARDGDFSSSPEKHSIIVRTDLALLSTRLSQTPAFDWADMVKEGCSLFKHVLAHEFGHALGLDDHVNEPNSIMDGREWDDNKQLCAPSANDVVAVKANYQSRNQGGP